MLFYYVTNKLLCKLSRKDVNNLIISLGYGIIQGGGDKMNYTQFYKEVRGYASNYASRLFRDEGMRIEAVDKAMDSVVDRLLREEINVSLGKRIAHSSLVDTFRAVLTNKNKNLKVRLSQIPGRANEIMTLYSRGMRQVDIAHRLKIPESNISRAVRKWTIW